MRLSESCPPAQDNVGQTRQERSQPRYRGIAIETALESFTLSPYMHIYLQILLYYNRKRSSLSTIRTGRDLTPYNRGRTLSANARNPSISSISNHCTINTSTPALA